MRSFIFWKLVFAISSHVKTASCLSIAPEWFSVMAEMWHEVSHVCDHSNEAGQLLFVRGGGHLCYSLYFLRAGMHAISTVLPHQRMRPLDV